MTLRTWQDLRASLGLFVLVVAIGGGIAQISTNFENQRQQAYQQQQGQLDSIRNLYRQTKQDKQQIARWLPDFKALQRRGFIGKEDRIAWINALHLAAEHAQLLSLHYRLGKQRRHSPRVAMPGGGLTLYASDMTIEAGLLHEGDLLRLLRDLDRRTEALYQLQQCSLRRNEAQVRFQPAMENLIAVCTLQWITGLPGGEQQ